MPDKNGIRGLRLTKRLGGTSFWESAKTVTIGDASITTTKMLNKGSAVTGTTSHGSAVVVDGVSSKPDGDIAIRFDPAAINLHPSDKSGASTASHEMFHALQGGNGMSGQAMKAADWPIVSTAAAAQHASEVTAVADLTEAEAQQFVETAWVTQILEEQ